jgi:alginate O-acetyltransferase complex protein AlgI
MPCLGTSFDLGKILPPIGISFFTFQTISYSLDVYRGLVKPVKSIADFGFYVSFFPQLVAGPIVRAADFIPQLYKSYKLTHYEFGYGVYLILKGLTKKMLIGDYLAINLIDRVFANPASYSGFENLSALFGYSVQVYCDFSGYTDIAIGVAMLLGFYLPKNFNSPYKAKNVGDFWKRWHISLSSWLKDYLYIPMGGNRGASTFTYISLGVVLVFVVLLTGKLLFIPIFVFFIGLIWILTRFFPGIKLTVSTNINLMMTMLLGGLWHGSSWMFVIWGGLNGLGLVVYKFWKRVSPYEHSNHWLINTWRIALTFTFITFTRIWFRGESMQGTYELLSQVTGNFGWEAVPEMLTGYWKVLSLLVFGLVIHWLPDKVKCTYRDWFINRPLYQKVFIASAIIFVIYQSISAELTPFIYFQF